MNVFTTAVLTLVVVLSILPTRAMGASAPVQTGDPQHVIVSLRMPRPPVDVQTSASAETQRRHQVAQTQRRLLQAMGEQRVAVTRRYNVIPALALTTDAAGLDALRAAPEVAAIEPDIVVRPALAESVALVGAPQAWSTGYTGAGQTIAVLDTGVDRTQPFLTDKIVAEACYSDNLCPGGQTEQHGEGAARPCTSFYDCDHGTHVAGITAGQNGVLAGVAPGAQIIAIQVLSDKDAQLGANWSDILRGLEHVYELRTSYNIAAVNLSLASAEVYSDSAACDATYPAMKQTVDLLRSAGIATVIAAGNSGSNGVSAPACISSAISVGATTKRDTLWDRSNSGANLSLLAPGEQISSCVTGGTFMTLSGTSMAAPHVAGAWALLKSKQPGLTVDEALATLRSTGTPISNERNGVTTPRIRVDAALNAFSASSVQRVASRSALYLPLVGR